MWFCLRKPHTGLSWEVIIVQVRQPQDCRSPHSATDPHRPKTIDSAPLPVRQHQHRQMRINLLLQTHWAGAPFFSSGNFFLIRRLLKSLFDCSLSQFSLLLASNGVRRSDHNPLSKEGFLGLKLLYHDALLDINRWIFFLQHQVVSFHKAQLLFSDSLFLFQDDSL